MRLSYSSLDTYQNCPLKYKYQAIDKIKTPKSKEAVFGTLVHSTLKFAYEPGLIPPTLEQALDHFSRGWNSEVWGSELEERAAFSQGVDMLQKYYQKNNPADVNIVALESNFQLDVVDMEKPETIHTLKGIIDPARNASRSDAGGPLDKTPVVHTLKGIIDRIDKTENGYEIIDYKTGRKMPSQESVDQNLQLSIYLKAFLARYPHEVPNIENITVSLYYLKHGVKLSSKRTLEDLAKVDELFMNIVHEIEAGHFEPHVSPLCDWCGYQKICPMWRHKFKDARKIDSAEVNQAIDTYIATKRELVLGKQKITQLQETILKYMDQEDVERVFGAGGIVERAKRQTFKYDAEKVRSILEPLGLWDKVLKFDQTLTKKIADSLPSSERKVFETEAKIPDKETVTLRVKKA